MTAGFHRASWMALTLLLVLVPFAGCGGNDGGGSRMDIPQVDYGHVGTPDTGNPGSDIDVKGQDTTQPPPTDGLLTFVDLEGDDGRSCVDYYRCTRVYTSVEQKQLKVRYLEEDVPKGGVAIRFQIQDDTYAQGYLEPSNGIAMTDQNGVATMTLGLANVDNAAQFMVQATVSGRSDVLPIFFDVVVDPKGQPPLTVSFDYRGAQPIGSVVARLYRQPRDPAASDPSVPASYVRTGVSCVELVPYLRAGDFIPVSAYALSPEMEVEQSAVFVNEMFPDLPYDKFEMYTVVAVGETNGVTRIVGCDDTSGLLEEGRSKHVRVEMRDLPPRITGIYELRSEFDLLTALPDDVERVVRHILRFFSNPAGEVLILLCLPDIAFISDLCTYVFTNPDDPETSNYTTVGSIAVTLINGIIQGLTADSIWGDILGTGADIELLLTRLTFLSIVEFYDEADDDGYIPPESTYEEWTTIRYRWTLGMGSACQNNPDCGWNEFSFYAIGQEVVEGEFAAWLNTEQEGTHKPFTLLNIEPHPLNIKYGALVNYIIKNVVLPRLAGDGSDGYPRIDTYEELVKSILAGKECLLDEYQGGPSCCFTFADNLASQAGSVTVDIISAACDGLIDFGVAYLEQLLIGLDFDTGDPNGGTAFLLRTPDGVPCELIDYNDDLLIDSLGTATAPCSWDAVLRLNVGGGLDVVVDGIFTGARQ